MMKLTELELYWIHVNVSKIEIYLNTCIYSFMIVTMIKKNKKVK